MWRGEMPVEPGGDWRKAQSGSETRWGPLHGRKVREMVMAERGNQRTEAKSNAQGASVTSVVNIVAKLHGQGKQPTARAVSIAAGKSPTWATPYLESATDEGLLVSGKEPIPRRKDGATVYRPADSTAVAA